MFYRIGNSYPSGKDGLSLSRLTLIVIIRFLELFLPAFPLKHISRMPLDVIEQVFMVCLHMQEVFECLEQILGVVASILSRVGLPSRFEDIGTIVIFHLCHFIPFLSE